MGNRGHRSSITLYSIKLREKRVFDGNLVSGRSTYKIRTWYNSKRRNYGDRGIHFTGKGDRGSQVYIR